MKLEAPLQPRLSIHLGQVVRYPPQFPKKRLFSVTTATRALQAARRICVRHRVCISQLARQAHQYVPKPDCNLRAAIPGAINRTSYVAKCGGGRCIGMTTLNLHRGIRVSNLPASRHSVQSEDFPSRELFAKSPSGHPKRQIQAVQSRTRCSFALSRFSIKVSGQHRRHRGPNRSRLQYKRGALSGQISFFGN